MALARPVWRSDYANSRQLSPLETFTRASAASRMTKLGALAQAAANQPRFDYDPTSIACRGLLLEPASTNNATQSEFANGLSDVSSYSGLVTATTMAGFAGALAFGHNGSTSSWAYKIFSFAAGQAYAIAVIVEMTDGLVPVFGSATAQAAQNDFALVIAGQGVAPSRVEHMGGIRYRVIASTVAIPTNTSYGVVKYSSNSSRTFKVVGYDLRVGTSVDSYIATTTAAVTRTADALSIAGADFARVWRQDEGTILLRGRHGVWSGNQVLFSINGGSVANRYIVYRSSPGAYIVTMNLASTAPINTSLTSPGDNADFAVALSYGAGRFAVGLNGAVALDLVLSTALPVVTQAELAGQLGGTQLRGHISQVEFYPRAATAAELIEVTR